MIIICTKESKLCSTDNEYISCDYCNHLIWLNKLPSIQREGLFKYYKPIIYKALNKIFVEDSHLIFADNLKDSIVEWFGRRIDVPYCYREYSRLLYGAIYFEIYEYEKIYRDNESAYSLIRNIFDKVLCDFLIKTYGEINNPNNKIYLRYTRNKPKSLAELQFIDKGVGKASGETKIKSRRGQDKLRKILLENKGKCNLCGIDIPNYLKTSHIKPWEASNNYESRDLYNVLLLCSAHDTAFNDGDISFTNDGTIMISDSLNEYNKNLLNIHEGMNVELEEGHFKYLEYHRNKVFNKKI